MSQDNVQIVRRGFEAFNRRDIDAWPNASHTDAETHDLAVIPDAPVRHGHEDLKRWQEEMMELWEDARYEPQEFTEHGKFVLVMVRAIGRGSGSGVPLDVPIFFAFGMRDGRVQRSWSYLDRAKALKAAGLQE